ncbi:hypothetical protein J3L18_29600 [Mucilaginibacter gossypii]|uniref:hypothetical protein n=1 Tax=Mucilaginibacter gossypii TaxID=551996 RepID=UPI000DCD72BF|nr:MULTISPECIES: hypothetical protein [Mucilaginibacter]QTE37213.1 hypothetical protein J3L18_29600 [Mucilaginibacter gossypii]RAV57175.1 hypothetical protein DIU36_12685 [Mucilaginibacter rubeus]
MARILTSKQKAIEIISNRINDLSGFNYNNFNHVAWKARTISDLTEIFGAASNQVFNAQNLNFYDVVVTENTKVKENFRQLLKGYIDFINDHIPDVQRTEPVQTNWEAQYHEMHKLLIQSKKNFEDLNVIVLKRNETIEELSTELQSVRESVFNLEGLTITNC